MKKLSSLGKFKGDLGDLQIEVVVSKDDKTISIIPTHKLIDSSFKKLVVEPAVNFNKLEEIKIMEEMKRN